MKQVAIITALLCTLLFNVHTAQAQTTLAVGDIIFTGYTGVPVAGVAPDTFKFVLLSPISSSTTIYFTERGYQNPGWQGSGGTEGTISWVSGSALPVGTEIMIAGLGGSAATINGIPNGTVAQISGGNATTGLSLSNAADQVIAFQGGGGDPSAGGVTFIAGISWHLNCGTTTDAGWNGSGCTYGAQSSAMPPGLTGGTNAFLAGTAGAAPNNDHGVFNCTGTPFSTLAAIRAAVMNKANWTFGGATNTSIVKISTSCTYYSTCVAPTVTSNPPNRSICVNGNTTFGATATGTGLTYQWQQNSGFGFTNISNGGVFSNATTSTLTISGATAGMNGYMYRVVVTGTCGTATSNAGTLSVSNITASTNQNNISCNGGANGSASVSPSGGISSYTYSWSPSGGTNATATGLSAGNYTVLITDAISCTASRTFTITQPPAINLSSWSQTNIACNGGSTGAASVTPSGGAGGYTYSWAPSGGTGSSATGLSAGSYTVQVTDANTCTASRTFNITQPSALVLNPASQTNIACFGGNTGAAAVSAATGGAGGYTYNWTPGNPTGDGTVSVTGLTAQTYTVVVTDANSCTASRTFNITQPAAAVSGTTVVTNVACFGGNTGAINLTPTGGQGPYTFSWAGGVTSEDRTSLTAGTYTVTITDANGCNGIVSPTVTQPTSPVSGTTVVTNVACFGGNTGAINLTPTGGVPGYTFNWLPSGPTTEDRTSLTAGTYSVQITDANACTRTVTATVTQPAATVSGTMVVTNVACNGGSTGAINLTPTGGVGPYTFNWLPSGPTSEDRTGLTAGSYSVQITDANSCTGTVTVTVTQPTAISVTPASQTNIACNGGANGAAAINTPTGGAGGYTYNWIPGNPTGDGTVSVTGLAAGSWTVQVTDANSCTASQTFTVTQPTAISVTPASQTNIACNGGSNGAAAINTPTGGAGGYTYNWLPGNPVGDGTVSVTGLTAGSWTVQVTDVNSCTASQSFTVTQPTAISVTPASQTNVACFGGANGAAAINTPTGGAGGYTYNWLPGNPVGDGTVSVTGLAAGSWTVQVTDVNSCTASQSFTVTQPTAISVTPASQTNVSCNGGSNGAAAINTPTGGAGGYTYNWTPGNPTGDGTVSVTGLTAGSWTVHVTDANSCTASRTFTITQPTAISVTPASQTNVACFGGANGAAAINTPTGGAGGYTYNWLPGNPVGDGTVSVTGLTAGSWTVQVTDVNSCTASQSFTVTQPTAISVTPASQTNVACFGGANGAAAINTPTGGAGGYTYNWLPGNPVGDGTVSVTGLAAGSWTVQVTDVNSCTASQSFTVTQPTAISVTPASQTNVSCNGGANGAAAINTPTGGAGGYTYNWLPGNPVGDGTVSVTGLAAGSWTVQVTDANSCTASQAFTVTQPTAINSSVISLTNVYCNGGTNGAASINATGGAGSYTYSWAPSGGNAAMASGLAAGSYTVTIQDANACTKTQNVTITQPTALAATTSFTNATCSAADGSASISVSGGTPSYTYSWAPSGGTGATASGLSAGTYTVTATDANTCQISRTVTVGTTINLVVTPSQTNVSCNGGSNGTATVSVTGGSTPYIYSWAPSGGTNATATGLAAGTYTVTITDNVACQTTQTFTLTQPTAIAGSTAVTTVSCFGGANGAINFTATGGTPSYTYLWSNGATTEDVIGLTAGAYTVTVTDANACTASFSTTVSQPTALAPSTSFTNSLCSGLNNGSIDLAVSGGTAAYTYLWSNTATTQDISGLADGTYTVTVTDANSCTASASATLQSPVAVSTTTTVTNVNCNGGNNGKVVLNPTGGTTPYTYAWSTGATIDSIVNCTAGSYSYTVTDANSCNVTGTVSITQPTMLAINTTVTANVLCYGESTGAIDATVTGGVSPYTYNWSNSTHNEDLANAPAGSYTLAVIDANNCQISKGAGTITQPATALSFVLDSTKDVNCNGATTGSIYTTVSGGTSPYSIVWSNGSTADDATGLAAGSYSVTVTDDNGCSASVSATLTQPTLLTFDTTVTNISCYGASTGSIDVEVAGGTFPYQFAWSNASINEDLSNLVAGSYSLTITDGAGCTLPTGPIVVSQSPNFGGTLDSLKNVTCFGLSNGAIYLTAAGATPPYTYLWSNGATTDDIINVTAGAYVLTITDALGCNFNTPPFQVAQPSAPLAVAVTTANNLTCNGAANGSINITVTGGTASYMYMWSNGAITEDVVGLTAGAYQVTVTDVNGCTAVSQSVTLTEPSTLAAGIVTQAASCNGTATGTANLTVSGGTTAYSFVWSNGAITEDVAGLVAGTYTVTITDASNCSLSVSATVTEPALLVATAVPTNALCNAANGSVDLTVTGGTQPYGYNWSNSTTAEDLASVAAGTYSVTVNDNNGCIANTSVTVTQPTAIAITNTVLDLACNGGADGEVDIEVSGGTGTYSYAWSTSDNTQDVAGLTEGSYSVTVTDANNCTASATFTVAEPTALTLSTVADDASCNGATDGAIDLTVTGGTAPYSYVWSNAATTQDVTGLDADTYTVTVTDDNGCVNIVSATVSEPTALALNTQVTHVQCFAGNNGAIDLTVSGGTATYTYVWSNAATTEDITGLVANTYNVTVTDANTCSASAAIVVGEPTLLIASAVASPALCNGGTGLVDVTVTGGAPTYTFVWSNAATTEDIYDVAGAYTVTVTDNRQCTVTVTATVSQPSAITIQTQATNATCPGGANGVVDITVAGGTGAYTYVWSSGTTMQDASGLTAGTYSVTVTDANGCIATASATVNEPAAIAATANVQDVTCNGTGDGSITVSVSGGTGSYAYAWSNGANTANIGGLAGGAYTLTITDYNLCTAVFGPYTVVEPLPIVAALDSFDAVSCFGTSTGNVYVTVAGGTTPYTFAWSNGATTEDLIGVPAGIYTGTVTDANGCQFTSPQIPVTQPASAVAVAITTVNDVTCNGLANGEVMVSATGGTSPYTYAWSNNGTGDMIMGVVADIYTVSVTDANGCSVSVSATVNEPAVLTASATGTDVSCEGGSNGTVAVTTTGGTTPYTAVWSSGATTGLVVGTYDVTVTDANQCSTTATVDLTFTNTNPVVELGADVTQCGGTVTLDAGIANANYAWSNGGTAQTTVVGASTSYSVTVTTTAGCTGADTVQVTINAIPQVSFNVADTVCLNASPITLTANPAGGTFAGTLVSGDVFTPSAAGEQAVTYTYTDANNCSASASDTIVVNVCVGIEDIALATKLSVYPVPNTGAFTVAGSSFVSCQLTNNLGQALQYFDLNADNNYTYGVQNLSAGVYYVIATNGNASATYKVLVIE